MTKLDSTDGGLAAPAAASASSRDRDVLDPSPGGFAERIADRQRSHHPVTVAAVIAVAGYVLMGALIVGLGLLLTHVLLDGGLGRWDDRVDAWFVARRTPSLNTVTSFATTIGSTGVVVAVAALVAVVLAFRRLWREVGMIVIALAVEASVFLTAAVIVNRPRPSVPRLDPSPPTASFPSGHTAAAIVLWVSLAIVFSTRVRSSLGRAVVWIIAIGLPVFVGISRLYRGMHHPTDVFASVILGVAAVLIALLAVRSASGVARLRSGSAPDDRGRGRVEVAS